MAVSYSTELVDSFMEDNLMKEEDLGELLTFRLLVDEVHERTNSS